MIKSWAWGLPAEGRSTCTEQSVVQLLSYYYFSFYSFATKGKSPGLTGLKAEIYLSSLKRGIVVWVSQMEMAKVYIEKQCFCSVNWRPAHACIRICRPLLNAVTIEQHPISAFKLAILNKLKPRRIGSKDVGPVLRFLILGIRGEFQTNITVHLIK